MGLSNLVTKTRSLKKRELKSNKENIENEKWNYKTVPRRTNARLKYRLLDVAKFKRPITFHHYVKIKGDVVELFVTKLKHLPNIWKKFAQKQK